MHRADHFSSSPSGVDADGSLIVREVETEIVAGGESGDGVLLAEVFEIGEGVVMRNGVEGEDGLELVLGEIGERGGLQG